MGAAHSIALGSPRRLSDDQLRELRPSQFGRTPTDPARGAQIAVVVIQ